MAKKITTLDTLIRYFQSSYSHKIADDPMTKEAVIGQVKNFVAFPDTFYYVVEVGTSELVYVSETVEGVLGYPPEMLRLDFLYQLIHPEDLPVVLEAVKSVYDFCFQEKFDAQKDFYSIEYRMQKADGTYCWILRKAIIIATDIKGNMLYTLGICSDITRLKKNDKVEVCFFSETADKIRFSIHQFYPHIDVLSEREIEILQLIMDGKNSKEISLELFISEKTVNTHRQNMLRKTGTKNYGELIAYAMRTIHSLS